MDKALKQRLVGASVLIALAVIILPMLLGGRPEPGQQTSEQIELPARPEGASFETRRFPLGKEPAAPEISETADERSMAGEVVDAETAGELSPGAGLANPAVDVAGTGSAEPIADAPVPPSGEAQEGLPPVTTVEVPVTERTDLQVDAPAPGPVESSPAANPGATGRYVVQVASLASEANARKLQAELEAKGFTVISDRIESDVGRLSRIRVGPYDSEAEATAAARKIGGQVDGVSPRTVDLDPSGAQSLNPSDPLVRWVVQLGSFGESSNAENLVKQVREQGLSAYSEKVTSSSGSSINRVRVGPFLQREDATKAQQSLNTSLGINGVVMSAD